MSERMCKDCGHDQHRDVCMQDITNAEDMATNMVHFCRCYPEQRGAVQ